MIILDNIKKHYCHNNTTSEVLSNVNLHISTGEIYAVIGKSGAGKSTLLRCVNLLEPPSSGRVSINNTDLTTLNKHQLRQFRKRIGVIFQHFNLLASQTVWKNIALPLTLSHHAPKDIPSRVNELLKLVSLENFSQQYPHQLSGGQKQRVAIARALATNPDILLCDEPTSALDPESTADILQLLKDINQQLKLTVLWITHEMDVVKAIADRVGVLHQGELVEEGKVIDIFTRPKHAITQRLVQPSIHRTLPTVLQQGLQKQHQSGLYPVLRITFTGSKTNTPILVRLQQQVNVSINVLQANFEHVGDALMGFVVCQCIGEPSAINNALTLLSEYELNVEELGYV